MKFQPNPQAHMSLHPDVEEGGWLQPRHASTGAAYMQAQLVLATMPICRDLRLPVPETSENQIVSDLITSATSTRPGYAGTRARVIAVDPDMKIDPTPVPLYTVGPYYFAIPAGHNSVAYFVKPADNVPAETDEHGTFVTVVMGLPLAEPVYTKTSASVINNPAADPALEVAGAAVTEALSGTDEETQSTLKAFAHADRADTTPKATDNQAQSDAPSVSALEVLTGAPDV